MRYEWLGSTGIRLHEHEHEPEWCSWGGWRCKECCLSMGRTLESYEMRRFLARTGQ